MTEAKLIDGKAAAAALRHRVGDGVAGLIARGGPTPGLATVLVGADPASQVYVRSKARLAGELGMASFDFRLDEATSEAALLGVIVANAWVGIPFNMLLLYAGLQNLSPTLYEVAHIDGATMFQRFRYITLPLMRPVAYGVLLLAFIYTFKVFDLIYVMTAGGPVDATTVLPIFTHKLSFSFFRFGEETK